MKKKQKSVFAPQARKGFSVGHKMRVFILLELVGVAVLAALYFGLLAV